VEALLSVDGLNVVGRLHKRYDFAIGNVLGGSSKLDVVTNGCKEGGLVDEKKVS
jgi:hypothetical protein